MPRISSLLLLALGASAAGAAYAADPSVPSECNSPVEHEVARRILLDTAVDLSAGASDSARTVRGTCLRRLLSKTAGGSAATHLTLTGAIVSGPLNLDRQKIGIPVILVRAEFRDTFTVRRANFSDDVVLDGSTFHGLFEVDRAAFGGLLALRGAEFRRRVNAYGLSVAREVEAEGAVFHAPADFRGAHVKGDARFARITADSGADFSRARFEGDLILDHSRFLNDSARLSFERTRVDQSLFLNSLDTVATAVSMRYTDVGVNLRADSTRWMGLVNMGGLKTGMHLDLAADTFHQPLLLDGARIGGDLRLTRTRFEPRAAAILALATVGGTADLRGADFGGRAGLEGMKVAGRMDLEGSTFRRSLSLRDVAAAALVIHRVSAPAERDSFQIDGMTYGRLLGQGGGPTNPDSLIAFVSRAQFSAGAFASLEKFFADQGDRRSANRTLFSREKWERRELKPASEIGSLIMMATVAYGRWPALAFVWCAVFIGMGMRIFSRARIEEVEPGKSSLRTFDPFWYSFDTFLPAVNLRCADDWRLVKEDSPGAWLYLRIHTLAGWVLIPIGLAAISGLLK